MFMPGVTQRVPADDSGYGVADVTGVTLVRVVSTGGAHLKFDASAGTAATFEDLYIPANVPEFLSVPTDTTTLHIRSGGTTWVTPDITPA